MDFKEYLKRKKNIEWINSIIEDPQTDPKLLEDFYKKMEEFQEKNSKLTGKQKDEYIKFIKEINSFEKEYQEIKKIFGEEK